VIMRFLKFSLLLLLLGALDTKADTAANIEMGMAVAPYAIALYADKPGEVIGATLASHLVSTGSYLLAPKKIEPWTMSAATSAALICRYERRACFPALGAAAYVIKSKAQGSTNSRAWGFTIGAASGILVPSLIATF